MLPEPTGETPVDPEDRDYLSYNWGYLPWSPWIPFSAGKPAFQEIPHEPGVYRIKPVGRDCLMYVGETGRSLYLRLHDLRIELRNCNQMPWSDPHAEAPALWAWQDAAGFKDPKEHSDPGLEENLQDSVTPGDVSEPQEDEGPVRALRFECSAAPLDASAGGRKGMEHFLLSRYRLERDESTLCNFGRFHPRYRKSTTRKEGRRGGRLADSQKDNPAGWPGITPLDVTGKPGDSDWMGLEWTDNLALSAENIAGVAPGAGLYLLSDAVSREIVYIGQSADIGKRLLGHSRKPSDDRSLAFSYQIIGQSVLPHNLKEMETDLIGNFFENFRKAPEFQFPGGR
ncbi:MAG: hypothetical protein WCX22_00740 [Methanoregula sp.]